MSIYSLLICGGVADVNFYDEFWNDTARMWEILQRPVEDKGLGISNDNIFVFYGNGKDFKDPRNIMTQYCYERPLHRRPIRKVQPLKPVLQRKGPVTDYPATLTHIEKVFKSLQNKKDLDVLFIWTFGHGFRDETSSYLLLADGSKLYDYKLAEMLEKFKCKTRIICMQQCFSGGFIDNLMKDDSNIIMTACSDLGSAYPTNESCEADNLMGVLYSHGEFNYYLYNAINKGKINANDLASGDHNKICNMMYDAYTYISGMDNIKEESTQYYDSIHRYCNKGPEMVDYLKSRWTFSWKNADIEESGPLIEFSYALTDIYRDPKSKQIYLDINGQRSHFFNINNSVYTISKLEPNEYGLDGTFEADFIEKSITYSGKVFSRCIKPYCIGYQPMTNNKSYKNNAGGMDCKIKVFSWE